MERGRLGPRTRAPRVWRRASTVRGLGGSLGVCRYLERRPRLRSSMSSSQELSTFIWQIADLLRGPYRPPQYERVMLPMTVLRRFDCVLDGPSKQAVVDEYEQLRATGASDEVIDRKLNKLAGYRFHNHSPLTFEKPQRRPRPDRPTPRLLHRRVLPERPGHLRQVRLHEGGREDGRGQPPLPRRLHVRRRGPPPRQGGQRHDGDPVRGPHPPVQRAGQRDRGRPLHARATWSS